MNLTYESEAIRPVKIYSLATPWVNFTRKNDLLIFYCDILLDPNMGTAFNYLIYDSNLQIPSKTLIKMR